VQLFVTGRNRGQRHRRRGRLGTPSAAAPYTHGENSSRPGEIVYDPFCGSGSTLLAAHQLNRIGYGVEIDPGYVAVTLERLAALGLKPELAK
jgi:DNA modification methylase